MTGKQLATLDQLIFSNGDAIKPMQEELNSLRRILDQRKNKKYPPVIQMAAPPVAPNLLNRGGNMMDSTMMAAAGDESAASLAYAGEPDEAIKARIDVLTQQVTNTRNRLWPSIKAMLSSEQ